MSTLNLPTNFFFRRRVEGIQKFNEPVVGEGGVEIDRNCRPFMTHYQMVVGNQPASKAKIGGRSYVILDPLTLICTDDLAAFSDSILWTWQSFLSCLNWHKSRVKCSGDTRGFPTSTEVLRCLIWALSWTLSGIFI